MITMLHTYPTNNIKVNKLKAQYGDDLLFSNINFTLMSGEMLCIMGKNGSGKSTLMRLLTGLGDAAEGNIFWNDAPITHNQVYQANLHYIGHQTGLKSGMTVHENIQLLLLLHRMNMPDNIDAIINQLSLATLMQKSIRQLSAGQQKRVALLKLLLIPKPLWLLDEPLTSLDQATQEWVQAAIDQQRQQGGIVITSSHQPFTCISQPYFFLMIGEA
jgi:heme exporter protein A